MPISILRLNGGLSAILAMDYPSPVIGHPVIGYHPTSPDLRQNFTLGFVHRPQLVDPDKATVTSREKTTARCGRYSPEATSFVSESDVLSEGSGNHERS
jgi:hypothetical protein